MPSRATLEKVASDLLKQYYGKSDELEESEVCEEEQNEVTTSAKTYAESLQEEIEMETAPKSYDER